jgi:hypothetical protein
VAEAVVGAFGEAAKSSCRVDAEFPELVLDPPAITLDPRTILVKRSSDGGYLCLGLGAGAEFLHAVDEDEAFFCVADDPAQQDSIGAASPLARSTDASLRRLGAALALTKAGFDPDEPRDEGGRWTGSGASGAGGVAAATAAGAASATDIFTPSALVPALRQLAEKLLPASAAGPVAFLTTLFIPTNKSLISEGSVPDEPGLSYHFDRGTGVLTFTQERADGSKEVLFSGRQVADGVFRDRNGNVIGRNLGDSVAVDSDAIPGYRSRATPAPATQAGTQASSTAVANRSKPKLCPEPGPDQPGHKTEKDIAYEKYVGIIVNGESLPDGMAINLLNPMTNRYVHFDNCELRSGVMIEAKGTGYLKMFREKGPMPWLAIEAEMLRQSNSQLEAAQGRPIVWHVAEKEIVDYVRELFARNHRNITIVYTPPPDWPVFKWELLLDDGAYCNELRYLSAMLP